MLMINSFHWCTLYNVNCTFYISVRQDYTINHKFIFSTINISPGHPKGARKLAGGRIQRGKDAFTPRPAWLRLRDRR